MPRARARASSLARAAARHRALLRSSAAPHLISYRTLSPTLHASAPLPRRAPFLSRSLPRTLRALARPLHTSRASLAKILAADPIEAVCGSVLASRKHELTALAKTPSPAALCEMIGEYEGLIVRR